MLVFNIVVFNALTIHEYLAGGGNIKNCSAIPTTPASFPTPAEIEWTRTYGGSATEYGSSLIQTVDGGYALAGRTESYGAGKIDIWLVKTDAQGIMQWNRTFGGSASDSPSSLLQTMDGGFLIAGHTHSYGAGFSDIWLVKTDAQGIMQWNQSYGGTAFDYAWSLIQTTDGGFAMAGKTNSFGNGDWDMWLVKTNTNGSAQWTRTFGSIYSEGVSSVIQTIDGGFILVGYTDSYGCGMDDIWAVKTDENGNIQWTRTYGGLDHDRARGIIQTADGGLALIGETCSFNASRTDIWLVRTDANGNVQWNRTYGGIQSEQVSSIIQTADKGFVLAANTEIYHPTPYDVNILLFKTDTNGIMQWNLTYGDSLHIEEVSALIQTTDEGFALGGHVFRHGSEADMLLIKINVSSPSETTTDTTSSPIIDNAKQNLINAPFFVFFLIPLGIIGYYKRRK